MVGILAGADRGDVEVLALAELDGTVSIMGLPPHRGLIVRLCFFAVPRPDAPVPYYGDPPAEVATECDEVFGNLDRDLKEDSTETSFQHGFRIERPPGYYYMQLRVV